MTRLLVSVRSASEAAICLHEGVDLIDIKEPLRGSLGAADTSTIGAIARQVSGRVPLSVALGELLETESIRPPCAAGVRFAKLGLAGCRHHADWVVRWRNALANLPQGVTPVAVAYADCSAAGAPSPSAVLEHGVALGCGGLLIDTYDKRGGSLFAHLDSAAIAKLIQQARGHGLLCVVAGGLGPSEVARAMSLGPDYIAVRGAACGGRRDRSLDARRVAELVSLVHARSSLGARA